MLAVGLMFCGVVGVGGKAMTSALDQSDVPASLLAFTRQVSGPTTGKSNSMGRVQVVLMQLLSAREADANGSVACCSELRSSN